MSELEVVQEALVLVSRRHEVLKVALQELEGFGRRNEERAKRAMEEALASLDRCPDGKGGPAMRRVRGNAVIEAEARYHEAVRVHQVIRMRVAEALA